MAISDLPILSMLRTRMQWHQERQRVLAENVANADTPGFRPRDLAEPRLSAPGAAQPLNLARTAGGHLGPSAGGGFQASSQQGYDVRASGNSVSLEDEMLKVAQNQMDYQAATALYGRSLGLLKTAFGRR
jgi:flagellar basal-body rod protein FlgB